MLTISEDDLSGVEIQALLERHAAGMADASPPGTCHFFDLDALKAASVTVWSVWDGDDLAGCGAIHELDPRHGELKSMRTHDEHLGKGVGRSMLDHLIAVARQRGYERLSLETGNTPPFAAALGLYQSAGFVPCGPFGDYAQSDTDFNVYFTLDLARTA